MENDKSKELQERKQRLADAFKLATTKGIVISQKEFAKLIGVAPTTLSAAINGNERLLSETIVRRAEKAVREADAEKAEEKQKTPDAPAEEIKGEDLRAIVHEVCACVDKMCDTLNKERESHERIITSMLAAFKG